MQNFVAEKNYDSVMDFLSLKSDIGFFKLQKLLKNKDIKLNGVRIKQDLAISKGDKLEVYFVEAEIKLNIVYEDNDIIIINKSKGIEVSGVSSVETQVNKYLNGTKCIPIHRLDRNTLGLVVYAKNVEAEQSLILAFKEQRIDKYYRCLAINCPKPDKATLKAFLFKDAKKSQVYISDVMLKGYMPIETRYKVVEKFEGYCLLELQLITGRTHQIRAQLSHIGNCIIGDGKYGSNAINKKFNLFTQALASTKIILHFDNADYLYRLNNKIISYDSNLLQLIKHQI